MSKTPTLVINYHYCVGEKESPFLACTAVAPVLFARQMEQLARLQEERGIAPLVTFDDGTRDIWLNAVPALVRNGVPFILFVCSLPLAERRLLNVTKIHFLQSKLGLSVFQDRFMAALYALGQTYEMDDPARFHLGRIYRYDTEEVREFKMLLNVRLPYPLVTQVLDTLFVAEFGGQAQVARHLYMSEEEILRARDAGARIGLHTHSHFMLGRLDAAWQEFEIVTCRQYFADVLAQEKFDLSYPYGVPGTWNDDTKTILESANIAKAYTLGRRIHDENSAYDPYEIPRFDVNDVFTRDGVLKQEVLG
jgi:hypothetical protein